LLLLLLASDGSRLCKVEGLPAKACSLDPSQQRFNALSEDQQANDADSWPFENVNQSQPFVGGHSKAPGLPNFEADSDSRAAAAQLCPYALLLQSPELPNLTFWEAKSRNRLK
jgi:hypothetical protein